MSASSSPKFDDLATRYAASTVTESIPILVNCIGVNREQSANDVTEDVFDNVVALNLKSHVSGSGGRAAMIRQQSGGK
jgi:short-subunit dehydrogenase